MINQFSNDPIWGDINSLVNGGSNDVLELVDDHEVAVSEPVHEPWRVLIADDDLEIHQATQLALGHLIFENKPVNFESVYSGEEAKRFMASHPDTALVLLDVVMEQNNAGLEVAEHIRDVLHNKDVRIVLRTGQPGEAPEESVILNYDINDYKTKTELTSTRLFTSVISALRSYRDIQTIQLNQQKLADLNEALEHINNTLEKRVKARTERLEMIASLGEHLNTLLDVDNVLAELVQQVHAVLGYYQVEVYLLDEIQRTLVLQTGQQLETGAVKTIPLNDITQLVALAARQREIKRGYYSLDQTQVEIAVPILQEMQVMGVLRVRQYGSVGWDDGDINLFRFLANQVAIALKNAKLYTFVQQANRELKRLNADKDKFFSIVAHDLKGPFLPLLGNLELMQEMAESLKPQDVITMSRTSHRSAKRVLDLLDNLLTWAQLQMGRMAYQPKRLRLTEAVDRTVELLSGNALLKQIRLDNRVPLDLWVYADNHMLDLIIRNLVNNALKFTPSGGQVTLSARPAVPTSQTAPQNIGGFIEVSVRDTGVGMSREVQEKLFRIDQAMSLVGTAKEKGTGLGLIMCKEMVEKHGGQIWVESEVGQGTTMYFTVLLDNR